MADLVLNSILGQPVQLTTTNVRSMTLDGEKLAQKQISEIIVDGNTITVTKENIAIGPTSGKTKDVHGPYNQVTGHFALCIIRTKTTRLRSTCQSNQLLVYHRKRSCLCTASSELTSTLANE